MTKDQYEKLKEWLIADCERKLNALDIVWSMVNFQSRNEETKEPKEPSKRGRRPNGFYDEIINEVASRGDFFTTACIEALAKERGIDAGIWGIRSAIGRMVTEGKLVAGPKRANTKERQLYRLARATDNQE